VRSLVETGTLAGERGAYRLLKPAEALQIPATAQAVLAARIDRLAPEDKRLLQTASTIGKDLPYQLLNAIADMDEPTLRAGLARLQGAEFLYEIQLFPDAEYTFKHALTHDVAYGSLLQGRRRHLHARITDAIEQLYANRLAEHVERLAHHSASAEVWDKAVRYFRQAGLKAVDRLAHRDAIAYLEQALVALDHLPKTREVQEVAVDIRLDVFAPLLAVGDLDRRLERSCEAEQLAEAIGDARRLVRALIFTSNTLQHMGRTQEAVRRGQRCVELVRALDDPTLELLAEHYLGQAFQAAGAYREAVAHLRKSVGALRGEQASVSLGLGPFPSVLSRFYLGVSLAALGEFDEATAIAAEAVQIAEALDHAWSRVLAYTVVAQVDIQRGDADSALHPAVQALDLCTANDLRFLFPTLASFYGYILVLAGRIQEGTQLAERAVAASPAKSLEDALRRTWLAEVYLRASRPEAARDQALSALELAQESGQQGQVAWAARILGGIAALHPSLLGRDAEHYYREATTRADALGMRPLVAHCHLGLGKLCRRTGKQHEAHEHLTAATAMYREMGMTYWLEQAEAEQDT
jgi:tetratricopeptide (TPR) repeat protein